MEVILIPIIVFSSLLLFLKMLLDYARFKHEHKTGTRSKQRDGSSNSLAVSELEDLIEGAVEHAVRPLERRIRRLERATKSNAPAETSPENSDTERPSHQVLDDLDEHDEAASPLSSRGGNIYDVGAARPRVRRH